MAVTPYADEKTIRRLLAGATVWAIVGLGGDPARPAYQVANFLQRHGKRIVPVHPRAATVLGETGYRTLAEVPLRIDVVDVFRRSDKAGEIADQAIAVRAGAVWFQVGVIDVEAAARVVDAGLDMVMDTCPKIQWPRLGPDAPSGPDTGAAV